MTSLSVIRLSGIVARPITGDDGILELDQLQSLIRPDDIHQVRTKLVSLENTHNRGGGKVYPYETLVSICEWAHENGVKTHLDGARLFNAVAATGIEAAEWARHFDTVSVCFSKGLGAPIGSALAGPADAILEARRHRKAFGGGIRQAGVIAAAALYALENNVQRLVEDHEHGQVLVRAIENSEGLSLTFNSVETNLVFFEVDPALGTAAEFSEALRSRGILISPTNSQVLRAVTHLGLSHADVDQVADVLTELAAQGVSS